MVIFIAGLIGVGKTSLSKEVSRALSIYRYDADKVKKVVWPTDPRCEYNLRHNIPFSDRTRKKAFEIMAKDFLRLSKKHAHIIVDENLHKRGPRKILLDAAQKNFGGYLTVWIDLDPETVKRRLLKPRAGHVLTNPYGMYLSFKKKHDPLDADITFLNTKPLHASSKKLTLLIKKEIAKKAGTGKKEKS